MTSKASNLTAAAAARRVTRNSPQTPGSDASPANWMQKLEEKLSLHRESIVEELRESWKQSEERLLQRLSEFAGELTNVKLTVMSLESRVSAVEKNKADDMCALKTEISVLQKQFDKIESDSASTDLLINGIPSMNNESIGTIFANICKAINYQSPSIKEAFRLRSSNNNNRSPPIMVKLRSSHERNQLFKSIAGFCKTKKRSLVLSDIGVNGGGSIFVHESLTMANRKIMYHATQLKRQKKLTSAFSIRGKVFVRAQHDTIAIQVCSEKSVDEVASAGQKQQQSTTATTFSASREVNTR